MFVKWRTIYFRRRSKKKKKWKIELRTNMNLSSKIPSCFWFICKTFHPNWWSTDDELCVIQTELCFLFLVVVRSLCLCAVRSVYTSIMVKHMHSSIKTHRTPYTHTGTISCERIYERRLIDGIISFSFSFWNRITPEYRRQAGATSKCFASHWNVFLEGAIHWCAASECRYVFEIQYA